MKKLIFILGVFAMMFAGCSNDLNINNPVNNQLADEFVTREDLGGLRLNKTVTVSKLIDGSQGGFLFVGDQFNSQHGTSGSIYASCYFPSGAFSGSQTITMTVDDQTLTGTFSPHMEFDKPVSFSVLFTGVNLSAYTKSQFRFAYYGEDGIRTEVSSSYIYFDKEKGVLGILNAQLPHFSRYGFIRKAGEQDLTSVLK